MSLQQTLQRIPPNVSATEDELGQLEAEIGRAMRAAANVTHAQGLLDLERARRKAHRTVQAAPGTLASQLDVPDLRRAIELVKEAGRGTAAEVQAAEARMEQVLDQRRETDSGLRLYVDQRLSAMGSRELRRHLAAVRDAGDPDETLVRLGTRCFGLIEALDAGVLRALSQKPHLVLPSKEREVKVAGRLVALQARAVVCFMRACGRRVMFPVWTGDDNDQARWHDGTGACRSL